MLTIDSAAALAELGALQARLLTPLALLEAIGRHETEKAQQRIRETKLTPWGASWVPWKPDTMLDRIRKGNAEQGLLWDSGELLNSLHFEAYADSVTIGSELDYAPYLQNGTEHMDARPFLGWNEDEFSLVEGMALHYLFPEG